MNVGLTVVDEVAGLTCKEVTFEDTWNLVVDAFLLTTDAAMGWCILNQASYFESVTSSLLQTFKHKRSLLLLKTLTEGSTAGLEKAVLMDGKCLAKPCT